MILLIFLIGYQCQTKRVAVKSDYDFDKIKKILVIKFSDDPHHPNSGNIVADIFSQKLLSMGYDIKGRESVPPSEDFSIILEKAKKLNVDVIVTGSITKYSLEENIQPVKKDEKDITVSSGGDNQVTVSEHNKELIRSKGRVIGANSDLPYQVEATFGLIAKMIDVNTGDMIWSDRGDANAFGIDAAMDTVIDSMLTTLFDK